MDPRMHGPKTIGDTPGLGKVGQDGTLAGRAVPGECVNEWRI
jgi:hypothetical protein